MTLEISGNTIRNCGTGLYIEGNPDAVLKKNTFTDCKRAIAHVTQRDAPEEALESQAPKTLPNKRLASRVAKFCRSVSTNAIGSALGSLVVAGVTPS